jgi:uncharacterized membrane protein (UPF0127 family)
MSRFSCALFLLALGVAFGIKPVDACDGTAPAWRTMSESIVILRSDEGVTHHLAVKIAIKSAQRRAGFQNICSKWVQAWGVLFVFPTPQRYMFNMRNVTDDLDIAFIAADGRIFELQKMTQELDSAGGRSYRAAQPYRYALEVAAGRLLALGLDQGNWWLVLDPAWI